MRYRILVPVLIALVIFGVGLATFALRDDDAPAARPSGPPGSAAPASTPREPGAEKLRMSGPTELRRALEYLVSEFEFVNPDVDVELTLGNSLRQFGALANGNPPHLFVAQQPLVDMIDPGRMVAEPTRLGEDVLEIIVRSGNPTAMPGLAAFQPGSTGRSGLCPVEQQCGALAAQKLQAAGIPVAPDTLAAAGDVLADSVADGEVDVGMVLRSQSITRFRLLNSLRFPPEAGSPVITYEIARPVNSRAATRFLTWLETSESAFKVRRATGLVSLFAQPPS
jgi:hypothetical protein